MVRSLLLSLCFVCGLAAGAAADDSAAALAAYKSADFAAALPLLRSAAAASPQDPSWQAAELSALTQLNRIDEAAALDARLSTAFANSAPVLAARGEWAYHMGDFPSAEHLFKAAIQLDDNNARAIFGMSLLCRAASLHHTARLYCLRAHILDADDALITRQWLRYVPADKRKSLLDPFAAAHPWLYKFHDSANATSLAIQEAVGKRTIYALAGVRQETTLHFIQLLTDPRHSRGVGLELRLNGSRPLHVLFDTGASGILLKQSTIDHLGLQHLGSSIAWGIGDKGARPTFASLADTCQIANLQFTTCVVGALAGKSSLDVDGLIGASFFSDYIVTIDFARDLLHLKPLPARPDDAQGYDRQPLPEEASFTPVFELGGHLLVSTKVNGRQTGLFLLDTGSNTSVIDSTFARLSTKIHGDSYMHASGVSGSVAKVFEADKAELQFARFRQRNVGLTSFDLNGSSPVPDLVRTSGILGMPVLSMFRLTIDYRNGLVNFDYIGGSH